jgi:putative nucleotidyltransferase with HDIG domain
VSNTCTGGSKDDSNPRTGSRFISNSKMLRDAYDGNGLLLLPAGAQIDLETNVDRLRKDDVRFSPTKSGDRPQASPHSKRDHAGQVDASHSTRAAREILLKRTEEAKALRAETTVAVSSIFERALNEEVDYEDVQNVVSPLVTAIVNDSRTLLSLVNLKNADAYTFTHSVNVAILTTALALKSGNQDRLEETATGAIMHDIGKTSTPNGILNKPGPLNSQELAVMRQHPVVGASILMKSGGFSPWVINAVIDHHESFAGNGYPRSRKASQIGVPARMISLADVYDALTTCRPYRDALSPKVAITMMMEKMSDAFDPHYLETFVSIVGYYPTGTFVELSNGFKAQVIMVDPDNMSRPAIVEVVEDSKGKRVPNPFMLDLRVQKGVSVRAKAGEPTLDELSPMITHEFHPFEAVA